MASLLDESAAAYLAEAGAVLVGIDSLNIDDTADAPDGPHHPSGAGIPIVEHLRASNNCLMTGFGSLQSRQGEAFGTFPVRAFAVLNLEELLGPRP